MPSPETEVAPVSTNFGIDSAASGSFSQYSTVDWHRDQLQLRTGTEDDFVLQIDGID